MFSKFIAPLIAQVTTPGQQLCEYALVQIVKLGGGQKKIIHDSKSGMYNPKANQSPLLFVIGVVGQTRTDLPRNTNDYFADVLPTIKIV